MKGEEGMASYLRDREAKARSSEKTSPLRKDEESCAEGVTRDSYRE